jgi:hypothetical protein
VNLRVLGSFSVVRGRIKLQERGPASREEER